MSRSFHSLYRNNLSRSNYTFETRPPLLNSWEGLGFDFNQSSMVKLAEDAAGLGCTLFVNDDGWFGTDYPRNNDSLGLGDWTPNPAKFPDGLRPYVDQVDDIIVKNSSEHMQFGLWVEPEMVNPDSDLYKEHPDWCMHAGNHNRTLQRNQLVLDLGLQEVQEYIITVIEEILDSAPIRYISGTTIVVCTRCRRRLLTTHTC